ncbi:MAG TPA: hypothetical protein DCY54_03030 [Parachlamydiales bacterium]|nr:hypothetical protein [Parachlamydiales bacterium]HCJ84227.1 hypothetical protein [Parachlamydiales bacterium]
MAFKFLIVKTSAIGDVLLSLEAISYLYCRIPDAQIDWVVERESASLLKAHPGLHRVIVSDTKRWRRSFLAKEHREEMMLFIRELQKESYDVLFDLQGNSKSAIFTALARAKDKVGFSLSSVPELCNLFATNCRFSLSEEESLRKRYLFLVQSYFKDPSPFTPPSIEFVLTEEEKSRLHELLLHPVLQQEGPKIMICFGSKWKNKQLPFSLLKSLLEEIAEALHPVYLFPCGTAQEQEMGGELEESFSGRSLSLKEMTLPLWQALMAQMDALMTMDSAALHLCNTTKTPSFSLFGPSLASLYKPQGEAHLAIQGSCPYGVMFKMRCPKLRTCSTGACMSAYGAKELAERFIRHVQAFGKVNH